jgi:GMP synthase PP-ATPase subunit
MEKNIDNIIKLATLTGKTCMLMHIKESLAKELLDKELSDIRTELLTIIGKSSEEIAQIDFLLRGGIYSDEELAWINSLQKEVDSFNKNQKVD